MNKDDKWALIAVSRQGVKKAIEVSQCIEEKKPDIYTMAKYQTVQTQLIEGKISDFFGQLMKCYNTILCIMATGIVVRSVAPHLEHKSEDPGILVMDPEGKYVISLLSGHLGHANANAVYLAKRVGAEPVITTGTDVKGSMAVDVLCEKIGCSIVDYTDAKDVTALILDDEPVGILNSAGCDFTGVVLPENLQIVDVTRTAQKSGLIITSIDATIKDMQMPTVQIVPKQIVVGIGCRKNTEGYRIIEALNEVLSELNISPLSIKWFASIGLKEEEAGIHEACQHFKATLKIIPDNLVKMAQHQFEGSDFVEKITGLRAVCEPCGMIASGFGECLMEKRKCQGITLSIWKISKN